MKSLKKQGSDEISLEEYTDVTLEILTTLQAFNRTHLNLTLTVHRLKGMQGAPEKVRDFFLEVSKLCHFGQNVFPSSFLENIGEIRSMTTRFFRTLVALIYTAAAKPEAEWPKAEKIVESFEMQLMLMQELAHVLSDQETSVFRFEEANQRAKHELSQISLSEMKEEREAARAKRMAALKPQAKADSQKSKMKARRAGTRLVGFSQKGLSGEIDFQPTVSRTSSMELDEEELAEEVADKHEMLLELVSLDDVDGVSKVLAMLHRNARELVRGDKLYESPKAMWKGACSNISRIRELSTQKVLAIVLKHRDSQSEVLLHKVKSTAMYQVLAKFDPEMETATNWDKQTPLQVYMNGGSHDTDKIRQLATQDVRQMLTMDGDNVNTCMRLGRDGRAVVEEFFASWEITRAALRSKHPLVSLQEMEPKGSWPEVLQYHLFHETEVWERGRLTERAKKRLMDVWHCVRRLLKKVERRAMDMKAASSALHDVKELLMATRGPRTLDARSPYREDLTKAMMQLQMQSQKLLDEFYAGLKGVAAEELRSIPSGLHPDLLPDDLVRKTGIQPSIRMDYDLTWTEQHKDEAMSLHVKKEDDEISSLARAAKVIKLDAPAWVCHGKDADWKEVIESLEKVGMITNDADKNFQLLQFAVGGQSDKEADDDYNFQILHWYAAWLRGCCEVQRDAIHDEIMEAFRAMNPEEGYKGETGNISFRREAKKFQRICEKTRDRIEEIRDEFEMLRDGDNKDITVDGQMKTLISQTAAYICDIAGCTFIADDEEEAIGAFNALSGLVRPILMDQKLGSTMIWKDHFHLEPDFLFCDNFKTYDYFEVSFDLCLLSIKEERQHVVTFGCKGKLLPGIFIVAGHLCCIVGSPRSHVACFATKPLEEGVEVTVAVRLTGSELSIHMNGEQIGSTPAGLGQAPGQLGVRVRTADWGEGVAKAFISLLRYRALDMHGKTLHWHSIRGAVQPVLQTEEYAVPESGEDGPLYCWGDARCRTRVLRVKNLFHHDAQGVGGYRDLKMWVAVETPIGPLIAEVQLILRRGFNEKKWMHLPYEYFRGSLDWGDYRPEPTQDEEHDEVVRSAQVGKTSAMLDADQDMLFSNLSSVCSLMAMEKKIASHRASQRGG